jgi:hypothetical protein
MRGWGTTFLVVAGCCSGGAGGGCSGDDDTDGSTDCNEFLLSEPFPEPGATDVFERTTVDAVAGQPVPNATIRVTDSAGAEVAGTSTSDLGYISFDVDGSYTPGETYTATVSGWSSSGNCPDEITTFTVADPPLAPIADPTTLVGRTWQLDLRGGRAVFPFNMDDVLADQMKVDLLVGVLDAPGTDLSLRASSTTEARDAQDLDSDTTDFTADFSGNPYLRVEEDRLRLVIFNDVITAMDLTLTSAWDETAGTWVETAIHTIIDTRELVDVVVTDPDPEDSAVCDLFSSTFGVRCHDCPASDDLFPEGGSYCITMVVDGMTMDETGYELVEVLPEP